MCTASPTSKILHMFFKTICFVIIGNLHAVYEIIQRDPPAPNTYFPPDILYNYST